MNERPRFPDAASRTRGEASPNEVATDAVAGQGGGAPEAPLRALKLRLRPATGLPALALSGRDDVLLGLLGTGPESARRLRVTYLLRRDGPPEVELEVTVPVPGAGGRQTATSPLTRSALEVIARVALPGFAAVAPGRALLAGPRTPLRPPQHVLFKASAASAPGPGPSAEAAPPVLALPPQDSPRPALDRALAGLAAADCNADLILEFAPAPLTAATLRVLTETEGRLLATTVAPDALSAATAQAELSRVRRWLRAEGLVMRLDASLRIAEAAGPAAAPLAQALLYGTPATDVAPSPRVDLSPCVLPGAAIPALSVHPRTTETISMLARERRPRAASGGALQLGVDELGRKVTVGADDLRQHAYLVGQTGTGKSTLLRRMALADAAAGIPLCVIDPHGDLHAELLATLPREVLDKAIVADAGDFDAPFSVNILEVKGPHAAIQRNFIANQLIALFKIVYGDNKDAFGPVFEQFFRASLFLLMDAGGPRASLIDLERVFGDRAYRQGLLEKCTDRSVVSFWKNIAQRAGGDLSIENVAPYITSKLVQIASNPLLRPIVCAPHTSLDLPGALAEGRTVLVNLAKGLIGGPDAALLGGIITIRLFAAAMARTRLPVAERGLTRVILDEFQTYGAHGILAEAMAEVRKYGLSLVLANQSVSQIDGRAGDVAHAILGNAGNLAVFRVGPKDAATLAEWLGPEVAPQTLMRLPNHSCMVRLLRNGVPLSPQLMQQGDFDQRPGAQRDS